MNEHDAKLISLALRAGDARPTILLEDIEGVQAIRSASTSGDVHGYWLLDVTATEDGRLVVIEANGSNGATSSIGHHDYHRVQHMCETVCSRGGPTVGEVAVLAHQDGFHHIPEFYARARAFVSGMEKLGVACHILAPGEEPKTAAYNVLVGDIPAIAPLLIRQGQDVNYFGARVAFATNPNLLPALDRHGVATDKLCLSFFHEGALALLAHDKAAQQEICMGTPFTPLWNREAMTPEQVVLHVQELHHRGLAAVVKPNATSGGTGVRIVPIGTDPAPVVSMIIAETIERYGAGTESTLFPLRTFEFAQAALLHRPDGPRLWDLRLELTASLGRVTARPVMVRVCPAPFSTDFPHDAVVSNLTGRVASTEFILSSMVVDQVRPGLLDDLVDAGLAWAIQASVWNP
ncbi:hypothetical protein HBA53_24525 (plasmid) [Rhodococcus pyridinivorans]|uniref:hypothetical protein n=1 Tax=Rhodococcus pyridinivorans TaxID=103816 RepID=UPI001C30E9BB|nr:hypothetical protein [Rhodococcus pyridinivorans]QXF84278.1 hypothetical protein HBA53_24525 [Rhodococcus pyridinivorans]